MSVASAPKNTRPRHLGQRLTHWAGLVSLLATFGGLLLITYYVSIRFMPDLDLSSMRPVLVTVATLGALIIAIFGAVMVLPAILWLTMLTDSITTHSATSPPSQHVRSFTLQFLLPLCSAVILPLPIYNLFELSSKSYTLSILGLFGPLLLWLAAAAVYLHRLGRVLQFSVVGLMAWVGWMVALVVISEALKLRSVVSNGQYPREGQDPFLVDTTAPEMSSITAKCTAWRA